MVKILPVTQKHIAEIKQISLKRAEAAKNYFLQASKSGNFNISEYATKGGYILASAKLDGTTLGENSTSLKILIHRHNNNSIFAILKNEKVLGAKGYIADKLSITSILDKLFKKGRIKQEEFQDAKVQLKCAYLERDLFGPWDC